jgi:hypothetical protein
VLTVDVGVLVVDGRDRLRRPRQNRTHLLDALAREQQVRRIDIAGLDEAAGLLGAPAGVRSIHEAALVVHEVVQVAPSAREALPEGLMMAMIASSGWPGILLPRTGRLPVPLSL